MGMIPISSKEKAVQWWEMPLKPFCGCCQAEDSELQPWRSKAGTCYMVCYKLEMFSVLHILSFKMSHDCFHSTPIYVCLNRKVFYFTYHRTKLTYHGIKLLLGIKFREDTWCFPRESNFLWHTSSRISDADERVLNLENKIWILICLCQ